MLAPDIVSAEVAMQNSIQAAQTVTDYMKSARAELLEYLMVGGFLHKSARYKKICWRIVLHGLMD